MKKIIMSLAIIAAVAAVVAGGTFAYFSDSDTSKTNTFTAGTLEISVNDDNDKWESGFVLDDMKPCYTDYINFRINNDGNNPVDIIKKLTFLSDEDVSYGLDGKENGINEPECEAYGGSWDGVTCDGGTSVNDIENVINYDLSVEVYVGNDVDPIWHQVIYRDSDNKTVGMLYSGTGSVYLGMIPVDGYMLVTQSYHMVESGISQNEYQSDKLAFDITIEGKQLIGTAVLDNKIDADGQPGSVFLTPNDVYGGTLTYDVKGPKFKFDFIGKAPSFNTEYVLAAGYDSGTNVDTYLGEFTTAGDGTFSFSGDIDLADDMKDAKVWFMPKATWNGGAITWANMGDFLWETGLIWYEDTDL